MDRNTILSIIYKVMAELNHEREDDDQLPLSESTILVGPDSALDSLGLVNLIVCIEEEVTDKLGLNLDITNEETLPRIDAQSSDGSTPLRTVGTLVDHIVMLLRGYDDD